MDPTHLSTEPRPCEGTSWDNRGMPGAVHDPDDLTERVRAACTTRDLHAFGALLSDDVRWGDDDHPRRCRTRSDVLATFRRLMDDGVEADITELVAGTNGLLCGLAVKWPTPGGHPSGRTLFHVYLVRDHHIVEVLELPRQTGHRTMLQLRARMTPRTSPGRDTQGNCGAARYYTT